MAECLLTTRGEKGDTGPKGNTGPKGDPGTPTMSQAPSLLGFSSTTSGSINTTYNGCSWASSSSRPSIYSVPSPSGHGICIFSNIRGTGHLTSGDNWSWTLYAGRRQSGDRYYGVHSMGSGYFNGGSCYTSSYVTVFSYQNSNDLAFVLDIPYSTSSKKPSGQGTFTLTGNYTLYYKTP